jgi:hypothetical protein
MHSVAVEIGEDRFGHSLKAAVLRNNGFVADGLDNCRTGSSL